MASNLIDGLIKPLRILEAITLPTRDCVDVMKACIAGAKPIEIPAPDCEHMHTYTHSREPLSYENDNNRYLLEKATTL